MKALIRNSCIAIAAIGLTLSNLSNAHDIRGSHSRDYHATDRHHSGLHKSWNHNNGKQKHYYVTKKHHGEAHRNHHRRDSYYGTHGFNNTFFYIKPFAFSLYDEHHPHRYRDPHATRHHSKNHHNSRDHYTGKGHKRYAQKH